MEKKPRLWTKPFILLVFANLFTFMSFQMLIPTLPARVDALGGSSVAVGLVTTLFSIAAVLMRPFIGYILGYSPRRKLVLIGSAALLAVTASYLALPIVIVFLILRFIHGLAWGWSTTANGTAAVDLVPPSRIGEGLGYYSLAIAIGMIIAPSVGIYVYQHYNFTAQIMLSVLLGIVAFILLAMIPYPKPAGWSQRELTFKHFHFFGAMVEKKGWYPALITLLAAFGYGAVVTFMVIFADEQHLNQVSLFYIFNAACATAVRPITGKWYDKKGPWSLVSLCALLSFVGMWVLAYANDNLDLAISGLLFGAGYGSLIPALQAWVLSKTDRERSGTANGMFFSSIDLGIGLSGLVMGAIKPFVETAALFEISSVCFLAVAVLTVLDYFKQPNANWRAIKEPTRRAN
ncbi:MFS transporter [Caenibacillus caldisaponilyticus]|uniref:MFS transporter n=1 Tax=Caenibacillus caldisaponilyticus TaxID=1674942 RepID=UPI0009882F57|nr:MFS transporter [Caenibacillus caldisaponilyticus]